MECQHPPLCPPSCAHCLAYDRTTRSLCSQAPSKDSKWCPEHEMLQAKLRKSYKRLTLAIEAFDDDSLPLNPAVINVEDSLRQLRAWSEDCRTKWGAIQRVINARREHHQQFYAGGDASHCLFVETLQTDSDRLERFMKLLDRRAYAIALAQTEAEWILTAPTSTFICDEPTAPLTPPTTPPSPSHSLPSSSLTKNQRKKAHRKQRKNSTSSTSSTSPSSDLDLALAPSCCAPSFDTSDLHARPQAQLAALRAYLLPPQDLPSTIRPTSWYALVATLIRYVVLRTPSLAPLAFAMSSSSSSASVEGFLDLLEERIDSRCGEEIEQLWKGMKFPTLEQAASSASTSVSKQKQKKQKDEIKPLLGVGILGDALADIFREGEERETGVYVELLGGKLYKEASERELNLEGWALFYQFVACAGCGLALTRTFASFLRNRRLALLGAFPAWLNPAESPAEHVLRLANISLNASNIHTAGVKVKRVEQKDDTGKRGKAGKKQVSIEEWERPWVYIRMLRENSWAQATLSALASQPERFVLLARDGSTGKMTHEPKIESSCHTRGCTCGARSDLWLGRVRSGLSPAERKSARWTMSSYFPTDSVLDSLSSNSSPEKRHGYDYAGEAYEVLLMDNRPHGTQSGEWHDFLNGVASVVMRSKPGSAGSGGGCESYDELRRRCALEACERGELPGWDERKTLTHAVLEEDLKARSMFREKW